MQAKTGGAMQMTLAMVISGTVGWPVVALGLPAVTVVFWRCAFGALAMLLVCALLGQLKRGALSRRQWGIAALGGAALVLNWTLLFAAYSQASIAVATVTYHVQPFMLVGLGALFFGERLTANRLGWLLLAFGGVILIVTGHSAGGDPGANYLLGVLMALGAALMYAIAAAIVKQLKTLPPQLLVLIQLSVGAVLLAPFAGFHTPAAPRDWLLLATLGLVHTGLMSTLLYSAIQKIPTSLVGALSFIYPAVAIVVDWAAFGHRLSLLQMLGTAAVLCAAAGMNFGWRLWRTARQADNLG
ncbi:DMT family transporter [Serratia entomophila]|uniref:DMT family transporter n=1 Tax=Serratia entomophila TaxID=42906 RepID=UPI00217C2BAF|nr:DMT family transporter [Serratia entomophila]CAI0783776.1 Predicted permease, DMT superfamily [Serratia entomophila]CAI0795924.1 Predicted permease, DMT superfamily [Serratia entomophila]CAI0796725.1 Predicted permease, DMT superfamily [Serratia entomophila]CAI1548905.1 Predicted permease, DMT superfamily [Serratia entomophila]CAI1597378.1 Predicted permease, DMT superfamily [Serratia entomophila]